MKKILIFVFVVAVLAGIALMPIPSALKALVGLVIGLGVAKVL